METIKDFSNRYSEEIKKSGIRINHDTDMILEMLLKINGYTDSVQLYKKISKLDNSVKKSKISSVLRRLSDKGILHKEKIPVNNHFVYRLRSLETILAEDQFVTSKSTNLGFF